MEKKGIDVEKMEGEGRENRNGSVFRQAHSIILYTLLS